MFSENESSSADGRRVEIPDDEDAPVPENSLHLRYDGRQVGEVVNGVDGDDAVHAIRAKRERPNVPSNRRERMCPGLFEHRAASVQDGRILGERPRRTARSPSQVENHLNRPIGQLQPGTEWIRIRSR